MSPSDTKQARWQRANLDRHAAHCRAYRKRKREKEAGRAIPDLCEICHNPGNLVFDHCHERGVFRGWLCTNCNLALGHAKDNIQVLTNMIAYLRNNGHGETDGS